MDRGVWGGRGTLCAASPCEQPVRPARSFGPIGRTNARCWLVLVCLGASLASAAGPGAPLLPLTGELSGDILPLKFPGVPKLHWQVSLKAGASGQRLAEIAVDGPGTRVRVAAQLDAAGDGRWRLESAEIDLANWLAALAPAVAPGLVGVDATGRVTLTGEGAWRGGQWNGRVHLELSEGSLRNAAQAWAVEGIAARGDFGQLPTFASDGPVSLTFREATAAGLTARNGVIEFSTNAAPVFAVLRATFALMDGEIALEPFTFNPAKPELHTDVQFAALELGRFASFLPPVLAEAQGRVGGSMSLAWTPTGGLQPGNGRLQIKSGEIAAIKLSPQPGFLTSHVPKRIALLPAWLGPIARAFSPVNPAYETLRAIEMGEMRLEVSALDVGLRPEGDANGRTARVVLIGRPAEGEVVESLRFEINVAGPLADVVRMGLEGRFNAHTR